MLSDEEKEALEILNNTEWDGFMITIKNLIEKQDKIINEMAEFIVHCDIDEDICQYMQDYMQDGGCGDRLECKKCIIEFYSKKVGE